MSNHSVAPGRNFHTLPMVAKNDESDASINSDSKPIQPRRRRHFTMIREFVLADVITLCNSASGSTSIFAALKYVTTQNKWFLYLSIWLLPLALLFDILDGRVARWRRTESLVGQELDSLADIISFGVAPAVLGFAIGLQGLFDVIVLLYFVNCGVSRLARYNATASKQKQENGGKIKYFEGTPIPTTVLIALFIHYLVSHDLFGDGKMLGGKLYLFGWTLHASVSMLYSCLAYCSYLCVEWNSSNL